MERLSAKVDFERLAQQALGGGCDLRVFQFQTAQGEQVRAWKDSLQFSLFPACFLEADIRDVAVVLFCLDGFVVAAVAYQVNGIAKFRTRSTSSTKNWRAPG